MTTVPLSGDIALSARPATPEAFEPYGRLIVAGDRARLGRRGGVLLALEEGRPGPRRVTHLLRFPEARRVVVPLGGAPLLVVVLPSGDQPGGPPEAFQTPAGAGVLINAGVWHADPTPLAEVPLLETVETAGAADRIDRRSVRDLLGADGLRVLLPEEPGAPGAALDLSAPGALTLASHLSGKVRLACVLLDRLTVRPEDPAVSEEEDALREALRGMWGRAVDLKQVPGIAEARALHEALGLRPEHVPPAPEALLARALAIGPLERQNAFLDALRLCILKVRVPMGAYDAHRIGDRIVVRTGGPGEGFPPPDREGRTLEGKPLLSDRGGPFGGIAADASRARVGIRTSRAVVVLWLPARVEDAAAEALLEEVARRLISACGGIVAGRVVVG
jgi:DNA/RNA-binding domain of Phe-tRNA-synthetase-like protein/ureidoglycolate hydrolase